MRTKVFTIVAMLAFAIPMLAFSQADGKKANENGTVSTTASSPQKAAAGTYQIIIYDTKTQYAYTDDLLIEIEKNRDENEIKYLDLSAIVRVKILPRKTINAPDFKPLSPDMINAN